MATRSLPEAATAIVGILEAFSSAERTRIIKATFALLGDDVPLGDTKAPKETSGKRDHDDSDRDSDELGLSEKTEKWLRQNNLTHAELQEVFHFSGGKVEIIASELPASSKRERTGQSYLLEGFRAFLETGESKFSDDAAMALTKRYGAFDVNNHGSSRKSMGNALSGSKQAGFELSQPGLRNAAALVKEIAKGAASPG